MEQLLKYKHVCQTRPWQLPLQTEHALPYETFHYNLWLLWISNISSFLRFTYLFVLYVSICLHVCIYTVYMRRGSATPEENFYFEALQIVVNCHVDAGLWTWVLCKSIKCFYMLSHLSRTTVKISTVYIQAEASASRCSIDFPYNESLYSLSSAHWRDFEMSLLKSITDNSHKVHLQGEFCGFPHV